MSNADRRHAVGVARRVVADLGPGAERPVVAAALLHDVGKIESGLGTFGRVAATVTGEVAGRARAQRWVTSRGARRRVGLYLSHPHLGADRLAAAGSDPLTVTWTAEHHLGAQAWTLDPDIAAALKAADDD
jgi:predicted HD phosphohydrolase